MQEIVSRGLRVNQWPNRSEWCIRRGNLRRSEVNQRLKIRVWLDQEVLRSREGMKISSE